MNNVASGYSVSLHQGIANVPMRQFGCSFLTSRQPRRGSGDEERRAREKAKEHLHTIWAMSGLSNTLGDQGKLGEAATMQRDVLVLLIGHLRLPICPDGNIRVLSH
jgi:hypothetical protein